MRHISRLQLNKILEARLSPRRFYHSQMVEQAAVRLAGTHQGDWYRAGLAALLHDICREDPLEWQRQYMESHGFAFCEEWLAHPQIWHGVCGSLYLKEELGVSDGAVLRAVRYHTTGRAGMSRLEQIVFVADIVSGDRSYPGVEEARQAARRSLDEAMHLCLSYQLAQAAKRGLPLVRESWEAYNEYSRKKAMGAKV